MARFHRWLTGSHLKDGQTSQVTERSTGGLWGVELATSAVLM